MVLSEQSDVPFSNLDVIFYSETIFMFHAFFIWFTRNCFFPYKAAVTFKVDQVQICSQTS